MGTRPLSVTLKVTQVIMKVVFISAILAVASAGFAPTCDECNAAAQGLLERLTSAESIAEQTGILISQVCPQAADAAACEAALSEYWGDMAGCLYPAFIGTSDACQRLGLCKVKSVLGDWTCDDCTAIMTRVSDFMVEPDTIAQGTELLQGECFCGNGHHSDECPDLGACHAGSVSCADGDYPRAVPRHPWSLLSSAFPHL